jgi:SAM-dependent methyltransferase
MKKISNKRFASIQKMELEWWTNSPHDPRRPWYYYDRVFLPHLDGNLGVVADIGCGPVPYFCNHNVLYEKAYAVDPLISEYMGLGKFNPFYCRSSFSGFYDVSELCDESVDVAFLLNTLDHAQDPESLLDEIARILVRKGRLFLFVDVDKKPDVMHPHTIDFGWLRHELDGRFERELREIFPSWKFDNRVIYYIGRKL